MGNCCSQSTLLAGQLVNGPGSNAWTNYDGQHVEDGQGYDSRYIAPELTDVFFAGLLRPVNTPTSVVDNTPKAIKRSKAEPNNNVEDLSVESFLSHGNLELNREYSKHPRLKDLMVVRDIWRSRIIFDYKISHRYALSPTSIGFGVCGSVRQIVDRKSQRSYALKSLRTFTSSRTKLTSIFNEIAIYAQLDHPNIAFLHEVYDELGVCHMVMEHCTGNELYDRLDNYKRFSESYTKQITLQMLLALNYLHCNGICHRDLKLENWVFATPDVGATLKMIDFGFARLFEDGVPMGGMHGTVYYVDPEVIDGCYNEKCDVWSTGVIVYMLLSGSPPFNGDADRDILLKIKKGSLKFEGVRWNQVSDTAKDFIRYLLNRNAKERCSVTQALRHPWLKEEIVKFDSNVMSPDMLRHIVAFSKRSPLHRAIISLCVLDADHNTHPEIYRSFFSINTSNTGSISLSEFAIAMKRHLGMNEQESAAIFDTIAYRGTPLLHYTEFVTSVFEYYTKVDINMLAQVYRKFDAFGHGRVDLKAFVSCLGENFNGTSVVSLFKEADSDGTGVLDFASFCDCVVNVQ